MIIELKMNCSSQHATTSKNLQKAKNEWGKTSRTMLVTMNSFKQFQPENWKTPNEQDGEKLGNTLSPFQELIELSEFKTAHLLIRLLVK